MINGFVPGNLWPENRTVFFRIHLPDVVISVRVATCGGKHRPVRRLPGIIVVKPVEPVAAIESVNKKQNPSGEMDVVAEIRFK
jgi:hypothetical protein